MDKNVACRSGVYVNENGNMEVWWQGVCYGNCLLEEVIDAELAALKIKDKGENDYGNVL